MSHYVMRLDPDDDYEEEHLVSDFDSPILAKLTAWLLNYGRPHEEVYFHAPTASPGVFDRRTVPTALLYLLRRRK